MKIQGSKIQLLTILGLIVLLFVTMSAYGSGPAPGTGDPHQLGPAIDGWVTITPSEEGKPDTPLRYTFIGSCQDDDIRIGVGNPTPGAPATPVPCGNENLYSVVTEVTLQEFFISCVPLDWIPETCLPNNKVLDIITPMIIHRVFQFEENEIDLVKEARIKVKFLGN